MPLFAKTNKNEKCYVERDIVTDALFDGCVCLRQRPAFALLSPIVRRAARDL